MIVYYQYIKLIHITKNDNIIVMLFYIFRKRLREKKIILNFNHLTM